jgi:hypothetical protein
MSQELFRRMTIGEGDKVVRIPALQAVTRSVLLAAIKGKSAAAREMLTILKMIEAGGKDISTLQASWLSHEEALEALDRGPTKIMRIIVDPNQETDLSQLTESEVDDLERLLSKARKPQITVG